MTHLLKSRPCLSFCPSSPTTALAAEGPGLRGCSDQEGLVAGSSENVAP